MGAGAGYTVKSSLYDFDTSNLTKKNKELSSKR